MAYIWNPVPGLLTTVNDSSTNIIDETVTVTGDPANATTDPITGDPIPAPDPDTFTVSGLDDIFVFSTQNNTFNVYTDIVGMIFPIRITYLHSPYKDSIGTVDNWNDLPVDASEIIKMETIVSSPFMTSFDVTASVGGDNPETVTYTIKVEHSYTTNKNTLQTEVTSRS